MIKNAAGNRRIRPTRKAAAPPRSRFLSEWKKAATTAGVLVGLSAGAFAQGVPPLPAVPPELLQFYRSGGEVRFCINAASSLAEFDRALAQTLADSLLIPAEFDEIVDVEPPFPFDYRFTVDEADLFVKVNNDCDAVMGYRLPRSGLIPDWLIVSRPYLESDMVLGVVDPNVERFADLPEGARIGSRIGTAGDTQFRSYLQALPREPVDRVPYVANDILLEDLASGALDGVLIWEPALYLAGGGDPATLGIHTATLPFDIEAITFSVALKSDGQFLRSLIDEAIALVLESGVLAELLAEFGLPEDAAATP